MQDECRNKREREVGEDSETASQCGEVGDDENGGRRAIGKRWTMEQDEALRKAVEEFGQRNWKSIASCVPGRNHAQCLQRWNKVLKPGLVKGHWSFEEDSILEQMVLQGCHSWGEVATHITGRTAKQCRERWRNHLDPSINKDPFTAEEDEKIQQAYQILGNRWSRIAELLPGRTEEAIKLRWKSLNPHLKTTARPGRPRLMTGETCVDSRSLLATNAAEIATPMYIKSEPNLVVTDKISTNLQPKSEPLLSPLPKIDSFKHFRSYTDRSRIGSFSLIDSNLNPSNETSSEEVTRKDAEILTELLRSNSNSLLSFGSTRDLASFIDMSPDELLASGELDEMLQAVSLANKEEKGGCYDSKMSMDDKSQINSMPSVRGGLSEQLQSFSGLLKAASASSQYFATSYNDLESTNLQMEPNAIDLEKVKHNEVADLFDSDVLEPIRKGKKLA